MSHTLNAEHLSERDHSKAAIICLDSMNPEWKISLLHN